MSLLLDGRNEEALRQELLRRAEAVLGLTGEPVEPGRVETAILTVAARISEEVTSRLDKVPDKQSDNFYSAVGIGRDPARPASVPVAFKLSDTAPDDLDAPAGTKLEASTGSTQTIFETETGINLARGSIAQVVGVDAKEDRIFVAVPTVVQAELPYLKPLERILTAGAGTGSTVLQISPVTGLVAGNAIIIETGAGPAEHGITKVDGDLVTVDPPLAAAAPQSAKIRDVVQFEPFETGAWDRQSHTLYFSHATLLDVPSEVRITISGLDVRQQPVWSWYGKLNEDDPEASWIEFDSAELAGGRWILTKGRGKPEKTNVEGRSGLWIRARLPGESERSESGQTVRISVTSGGACDKPQQEQRCDPAPKSVEYDAIAVTTPVVPNKPYYPFGREPRLFDSFYIGSNEAFGKAGAEISLCFELGGPRLGQIAAVTNGSTVEAYGIGTDGLLWRAVISDVGAATFSQVPGPVDSNGQGFVKQAFVTAQLKDGKVRLAIADNGAVHVAKFNYGSLLPEGAIDWTLLKDGSDAPAQPVTSIFLSDDPRQTVHALAGKRILSWVDGTTAAAPLANAVDLLPVPDGTEALLITWEGQPETSKWKVQRKRSATEALEDVAKVSPADFAKLSRAAWASARGDPYIGGFDDQTKLVITRVSAGASKVMVGTAPVQPIAFDTISNAEGLPPAIILANPQPTTFIPIEPDKYREVRSTDISPVPDGNRQFGTAGDWTLVQHSDQGLLYRKSFGGQTVGEISFEGAPSVVIREADVPLAADFLTFDENPDGPVFYLARNGQDDRLIMPLADTSVVGPANDAVFFEVEDPRADPFDVDASGTEIEITGPPTGSEIDILLIEGRLTAPRSVTAWHLKPAGNNWQKPEGFPAADLRCVLLNKSPPRPAPTYEAYFRLKDNSLADILSDGRPLASLYNPRVRLTGASVDTFSIPRRPAILAVPLPENLVDGTIARFALEAEPWNSVGPNQPANPALSWEYWNGTSWWALDPADLKDRTAHLQLNGGVFFTVPDDLQETDVGGRTLRWIRARLVGGDYGEARVEVRTKKVVDEQGATVDQQTVTRDVSAIRAPYIVDLSVGYCAIRAVNPEIILTADNLGVVDQTSANEADLPLHIFPPVATVLSPRRPDPASDEQVDCCERWPAPPIVVNDPPPVAAALSFDRAFLIALEQQPMRGLLSLYLDVVPAGAMAVSLEAAVFSNGEFRPSDIIRDETSKLTEPGVIAIDVVDPPDLVQLFGVAAYWLYISAARGTENWSPRLRGIYLNGVRATSVETRSVESIGTSTGAPQQTFLLAAPPVVADSLSLMVAEPIGTEEALGRGGQSEIAGMPGPWVPWLCVEQFPEGTGDEPERVFTLDPETGTVSFGDGATALVPPIGSAILAYEYKHVAGLDANEVLAGAELQTVGPLLGLDKVIALDAAQGGVDVEAPAAARKRASTKMRHQGRIVSLADVEEFILARVASVAQVRAANSGGGVRLVVVSKGDNPIPMPSALRALEAAVGGQSTSRLRAPGVLRASAPRVLEIEIGLEFDADPGVDWVALEDAAEAAVRKLLDHRSGGFDGRGWPVGVAPEPAAVSAALAGLADSGTLRDVEIRRKGGKPLPELSPDVLVRVAEVQVDRADKAAA